MSNAAITVENLGKAYRIGLKEEIPDTLVGAMTSWVKAPLKNFHRLRRLDTFAESAAGTATAPPDGEEDLSPSSPEDIIWALRDVSFEVQEGEVVGIIGRNGAGKSTLLKILSRITEPTTGRAVIRGRVSSLLEVGTGFHPELSGRENIYMNGTILGMSKREIDRKFDEIVDFSGVEKFLDTPIKRYSSGMKVRLAFSVAAHLEPEILIIDEVLAVGDAEFQRKCLGKMEGVAKSGRTVLFVSHNMSAIEQLCRTAIWIDRGHVHSIGETRPTVSTYLDYYRPTTNIPTYTCSREPSDSDAVLLSAHVSNACGQKSGFLKFREPFSICMEWRHHRQIPGVSYSVRVFNEQGILVFAVNTIGASDIALSNAGHHRIKCRIDPNVLTPGIYRIAIGAYVRPNRCVYDVQDCLIAEVSDVPFFQGNCFLAANNPVIAPNASWDAC